MPYTISQNVDPTKAALGEQSAGVLSLQKSLNALGAGLKEDSQYGALTQAAFAKYGSQLSGNTPAAPAPVVTPPAGSGTPASVANPPAGGSAPAPAAPGAPVVPPVAPVIPPAPAPAPVVTPAAPATVTPPAIDPNTPILQAGSKGAPVSTLQSLLGITSDGEFGPMTKAAVQAFQTAQGLTADGIVGPKTLEALNKAKSGPSAPATVMSGAGKVPADDPSNQYNTDTGAPNPKYKPKMPTTGNTQIDALIATLNNQSPQKSFSDVYKEVYNSLGLTDMKTAYADQTKEFTDLQNKKNDEKDEINNNPWYSEGVRQNKLKQLDAKYDGKETILTNKLKLLESNITNARSDAQFVSGKIMDQLEQSSKLTDDIILKAIDIAEKSADAEGKLISVSPGSTVVNARTGVPVYTAPKATTTAGEKKGYITFGSSKLEAARGDDGFVDPYVYKEAYDGWVNGYTDSQGVKHPSIGTAAEFATKFPPAKYVNPAASSIPNLLPSFLRNTTKAARGI